ncbi:isopeptide-forming domain-containing fimbrial protein, partial [Rhodococcus sp. ARC_M6]|uniref:isopeptide-forming domain-containing fimbrial protein n=1 Tax=Rhodococcus sp. ARC_M6 TaxID=2928852 RepID=UPI001FB3E5E0
MPNDLPPTRSAIFTAGLPPWVRAWTVVWTTIAMILGISGATAVVASAQPLLAQGGPAQAKAPARAAVLPDEQPPTGCAFSAPNTGNFSQNICWIDMSTFNQAAATTPAGQPMTVKLTDLYTIKFNAKLLNSIDGSTAKPHTGVAANPLPALSGYSALGDVAYTGVPQSVKPALYQEVPDMKGPNRVQSGGTVQLDNIDMIGPNGSVDNYGLVVADAESTDPVAVDDKEFLSFESDKAFRLIERTMGVNSTPTWPPLQACNGTMGGADGLTGLGTTSVRCDSWWDDDVSKNYSPGAVVLAATAPNTFSGTFGNTASDTSRQGLAFGILLPKVKIDKDLTRVTPGDDFTIGMSTGTFANAADAAAMELKSTNTGATDTAASTGWRMLLADTTPTPVTFWEKPTTSATKTANYATTWQCEVNGVSQNLQVGEVAQVALAPGDNAYCKIINTPVLVKKSSSPPSGDAVKVGDTITYTLNFQNPGTAAAAIDYTDYLADVMDNADITAVQATNGLTAALDGQTLKVGGTLAANTTGTVTYTATVKTLGDKVLNNYLAPGTTTPPTTCDSSTNLCTTHPIPGFELTKTADPVTGSTVQAGETITYTVTGTNTGKTALTPATITDDLSAVLSSATIVGTPTSSLPGTPSISGSTLTWSGNLAVGQSVVLTYKVKINDGVAAGTVLNNKVTGTAKPPTGPEITPPAVETNHSVPGFTLAKTANPVSGSTVQAGETITYTVTGSNAGKATLDPAMITDDLSAVLNNAAIDGPITATIDGAPVAAPALSGTTLTWTGVLEAGKSVVLTYKVKIKDGVAAGTVLNNKVTGTAKPPTGPEITPPGVETNHSVPGFTITKSAVPPTTTSVNGNDTITYTVTGANTGSTTLDPVTITDDLTAVLANADLIGTPTATIDGQPATAPVVNGNTLTWTGVLPAGKSVVLTYAVKVDAGVAGGTVLKNHVTGIAKPPTGPEITPPAVETEHPVTAAPGFAVTKTAAPVSGSTVKGGDTITYTVTGSNT